jgi:hypothetical protein
MATGNFARPERAKNTYAVFMRETETDEDGNEIETFVDWDEEHELLRDFFAELVESEIKGLPKFRLEYEKGDGSHLDVRRSYSSTDVGTLTGRITIGEYYVQVTMQVKTVSGYYEGANIDWDLDLDINGNVSDYLPEVSEIHEVGGQRNGNRGLAAIHAQNVYDRTGELMDIMDTLLDKVCEKCSTPLTVSARFSNGETWYAPVKK